MSDNQKDSAPRIEVENLSEADVGLMLDRATTDPDYRYRWVQTRPQRLTRMLARGYRFVEEDEGVKTLSDHADSRADGRIYNGDTVLMKVPVSVHKARRQKASELAQARLSVPRGQFKKKAREAGRKLGKDVNVVTGDKE